VTLETTRRS
jgi:hypothetical protein